MYAEIYSKVTLESCKLIIASNSVTQHGDAIYSLDNYNITFAEINRTTANNNVISCNKILQAGGIDVASNNFHNILFNENFNLVFCNNAANYGGAIYIVKIIVTYLLRKLPQQYLVITMLIMKVELYCLMITAI